MTTVYWKDERMVSAAEPATAAGRERLAAVVKVGVPS